MPYYVFCMSDSRIKSGRCDTSSSSEISVSTEVRETLDVVELPPKDFRTTQTSLLIVARQLCP